MLPSQAIYEIMLRILGLPTFKLLNRSGQLFGICYALQGDAQVKDCSILEIDITDDPFAAT